MLLDKDKIDLFIDKNEKWSVEKNSLVTQREFKNFSEALAFVVQLGILAEKQGHHPDIKLHSWNKVNVYLSTHSEGGITENDTKLAEELGKLI